VGTLEVYYWSMDRQDLERLTQTGWIAFLEGEDPDYPVRALEQDLAKLRQKIEEVRGGWMGR